MTGVYKIAVVLMLMSLINESECSPPYYSHFCSCEHHHPQTLLCKANFVAKVKILKKMKLHDLPDDRFPWGVSFYEYVDGKRVYIRDKFYVKILKTYKRTSGKTNKKVKLLVFPVDEFEYGCGPTEFVSSVGDKFVVGGTETDEGVEMELCEDFHEKWEDLTPVHKNLLRNGKYVNNCNCKICHEGNFFRNNYYSYYSYSDYDNIFNSTCNKSNDTCIYNINEETGRNPVEYEIALNNKKHILGHTEGDTGFDFGGCYQGNAFCMYSEKKGECRWKFHKKTDTTECEDKLNS